MVRVLRQGGVEQEESGNGVGGSIPEEDDGGQARGKSPSWPVYKGDFCNTYVHSIQPSLLPDM